MYMYMSIHIYMYMYMCKDSKIGNGWQLFLSGTTQYEPKSFSINFWSWKHKNLIADVITYFCSNAK